MRPKKRKDLVANSITIVDDEGNPKISMRAGGKSESGYAGISFYRGKGKKRYQALHIYISDHEGHSIIGFCHGPYKFGLSLAASERGAGVTIHDAGGKYLKSFGTSYAAPGLSGAEKKERKPRKMKTKTKAKIQG